MNKNNNKSNIIVIGIISLLVIGLGIIIFLNVSGNKKSAKKHYNIMSDEEKIEEHYDFSKEDAINLVKGNFDGDIYTFKAEAKSDGSYVVTVTNTLTKHDYIFYVDPGTKTYRIDEKSM